MQLIPEITKTIQMFDRYGKDTKAGKWQGVEDYKDFDMKVLRNHRMVFRCPRHKVSLQGMTHADQPWAEEHFQERMSGIPLNPGETYKIWPWNKFKESNDPFKNEEGKFSHTYMERFWPKKVGVKIDKDNDLLLRQGLRFTLGDLDDLIEHLKNNPYTRQAYLPIWFPEDTWAANHSKRVPCTLGYYFYIDDDRLHMIYTIRSCDMLRHWRNDIYLTCRLLQHVAEKVEIELGIVTIDIYNLHLFKNDFYAFNKREKNL